MMPVSWIVALRRVRSTVEDVMAVKSVSTSEVVRRSTWMSCTGRERTTWMRPGGGYETVVRRGKVDGEMCVAVMCVRRGIRV